MVGGHCLSFLQRHPMSIRQANGRSGFSAVELTIVIGIMASLVVLSAAQVVPMMHRASVQEAVASLQEANQRARSLAMNGQSLAYGVVIEPSEDNSEVIRVRIFSRSLSSQSRGDLALASDGQPIFDRPLDDAVVVWLGDIDLGSANTPVLEWYYDSSGRLTDVLGKPAVIAGINPSILAESVPWVGGTVADRITLLAPDTANNPGLSIRNARGDYIIGITIGGLGTFIDREISL